MVVQLVEQLTNDPLFEGLNPAAAGTGWKWAKIFSVLVNEARHSKTSNHYNKRCIDMMRSGSISSNKLNHYNYLDSLKGLAF